MNSSNGNSSCTRCGKPVTGYCSRDAKGNAYCHGCIDRLYGNGSHASTAGHVCALCGESFQAEEGAARLGGKGRYCPGCLKRLHGQRPLRRSNVSSLAIDSAFDQMLNEIIEEGPPFAIAG